jgi:hypothetical protein
MRQAHHGAHFFLFLVGRVPLVILTAEAPQLGACVYAKSVPAQGMRLWEAPSLGTKAASHLEKSK